MNRVRRLQLSILCLVGLGACATPKVVQTYTGPELPLSQVAIIKGKGEPAEFVANFADYAEGGLSANPTKLGGVLSGYPQELRVNPGTYTLMVRCGGSSSYAFPIIEVRVAAGITYEVSCSRTGANPTRIRAGITSTSQTEAPK